MTQVFGAIVPKLRKLIISLRASFWFVPSVIVLFSLILALFLIEVDSRIGTKIANEWPRIFGAGAEGSRGMLATIAGSTMTMLGLTFSMTLVTLSLASSQYTSRILRNFIRNRATQTVLGLFAGIFTYCLVVLRAIRGGETDFIPSISIFMGFLLALLGVGVIVFFIHHIASSIQASNIISDIARETISSMGNLYPSQDKTPVAITESKAREYIGLVENNKSGYIQTIDEEFLSGLARNLGVTIYIDHRIGDFVVSGKPLVSLSRKIELNGKDVKAIGEAFSIQRYRTIEQDGLFGIRQIVDIALKALSPGVNDTTTAVVCVDYLTSILSFLVTRKIPSDAFVEDGEVLLVVKRPTFRIFFFESFSQIIVAGRGNIAVQERILSSLETISNINMFERREKEIHLILDLISEIIEDSFRIPSEIRLLQNRITILRRSII